MEESKATNKPQLQRVDTDFERADELENSRVDNQTFRPEGANQPSAAQDGSATANS